MFGFQRRLVRRCEWLKLIPNDGFLPQSSHTDAIAVASWPISPRYPVAGRHEAEGRGRPVQVVTNGRKVSITGR
jgi:hypothetical protein